ncbi:uncharacterized protein LOC117918343 [Vitis riparia]|uniref:uncharacterized protein LOC117918343 n=1 Tax=Vitis riparia TaxID=96939 RepID=UPI00155A78E8|nr:uncharacterized protein LOC117918343 [Vitis riparia]
MSWLARSLANSLKLDDDDDGATSNVTDKESLSDRKSDDEQQQIDPETPTGRGVKEDLSELTKTLTRQFWGVASFLAPPPTSPRHDQISDSNSREPSDEAPFDESSPEESSDPVGIAGIRSDLSEIGGKFKTGISKLSNNMAVSEITKIASNFLQFGSEHETVDYNLVGGAVGVTEEVMAFVRNIAMHPETWLDFPLVDDEDSDDFDMSDAQQEHAMAVERLAPRLAALRIELCPGCLTEDCFWKIYFVLLHPRLSKHDAELLSTPQIVKARAKLTQELQSRTKAKPEPESERGTYLKETTNPPHEEHPSVPSSSQSESSPLKTSSIESATSIVASDFPTEKRTVLSTKVQIVDKSVVEEGPVKEIKNQDSLSGSSSRILDEKYEDDGDDWLKEESSEIVGAGRATMPLVNEEDVSFSDLEEDDGDAPTSYKKVTYGSDSSTKDSRDWVQLISSSADSAKDATGSEKVSAHNTETKESNDWLDVDDIDVV